MKNINYHHVSKIFPYFTKVKEINISCHIIFQVKMMERSTEFWDIIAHNFSLI